MKKICKIILFEIFVVFESIIIFYPVSYIGKVLRLKYWSLKYGFNKVKYIGRGAKIISKDNLKVGVNFVLEDNSLIANADSKGLFIGDNVGIANGCYLRTANHNIEDINKPWMDQGHIFKTIDFNNEQYSIVIENDVWIGAHVIILSGAKIGHGSVISSGSVVSSLIPPYSIVVGNPGRVVKNRLKK